MRATLRQGTSIVNLSQAHRESEGKRGGGVWCRVSHSTGGAFAQPATIVPHRLPVFPCVFPQERALGHFPVFAVGLAAAPLARPYVKAPLRWRPVFSVRKPFVS